MAHNKAAVGKVLPIAPFAITIIPHLLSVFNSPKAKSRPGLGAASVFGWSEVRRSALPSTSGVDEHWVVFNEFKRILIGPAKQDLIR